MQRFTLGEAEFVSHNRVLEQYPGADGLKTGYVCSSGWNIIASATRDGRRLVVVTLGNLNAKARTEKASLALDQGFASFAFNRPTLDSFPEQGASIRPVDMRPAVCRKTPQMAVAGPVPSFMAASARGDRASPALQAPPASAVADAVPVPPRRPLSFATMR